MTLLILFASLALIVSFICSLLEASLLSLPRSHVEWMVQQGSRAGATLQSLKANIDQPLAAILTLNTVAHTVGAAGVGAQSAIVFGSAAVGWASAGMTVAILVLSEIIPKTLGAVHTKRLATTTAWMTRAMIVLCFPIIVALEWVNRLIGYQRHTDRIGRMEVLSTIRLGADRGALDTRERLIALNLMNLSGIRLSDILTPRIVMETLPADMTAREVVARHNPLHFSRIPLTEGSVDRISSYVTRFDIHKAVVEGRGEQPLKQLGHRLIILPEVASVADAMEQMLDHNEHIALAVDEYGGIEGIVTLEDVMESLLGHEITDETDPVTDMRRLAGQ